MKKRLSVFQQIEFVTYPVLKSLTKVEITPKVTRELPRVSIDWMLATSYRRSKILMSDFNGERHDPDFLKFIKTMAWTHDGLAKSRELRW